MSINKKNKKKNNNLYENPVSDDSLEHIESQIEKMNETDVLSEKISIHDKLVDYTKTMENEINTMIDMLDNIDVNKTLDDIQYCDSNNIDDDIVNLNKMMENLKEEQVMQMKLNYLKKMIEQVQKCRTIAEKNKLTMTKVNK